MNSYFFFGFHIFKAFNATFMWQLYQKINLNWIAKLSLKYKLPINNLKTGQKITNKTDERFLTDGVISS